MRINEIFYSVQGEIDVGEPSVFVRLSGCNLNCKFCDTKYHKNGKTMTVVQVIKEIKKYDCYNIVITGGEPTLQDKEVCELIDLLNDKYYFTIETNGTNYTNCLEIVNAISCCPKKQAINLKVLEDIYYDNDNVRFKFVYENDTDDWWEDILNNLDVQPEDVYIMPEGATKKEQESKQKKVIEYCLKNKYNFTPRLHVLVWDNKKGV